MLAEMAQFHYDLVQGSFVILVNAFRKQDLVLVKESGAEARVRLQHNLNMCKNRIDVCDIGDYAAVCEGILHGSRLSRGRVCAATPHQ